jgi:hypothetical protein
LTTQLQNEEEELRELMIKCTGVSFLYRRRVGPEALPCFEVALLEGTVA